MEEGWEGEALRCRQMRMRHRRGSETTILCLSIHRYDHEDKKGKRKRERERERENPAFADAREKFPRARERISTETANGGTLRLPERGILRKRRNPGWVKDRVRCDVTGTARRIDIRLPSGVTASRETRPLLRVVDSLASPIRIPRRKFWALSVGTVSGNVESLGCYELRGSTD